MSFWTGISADNDQPPELLLSEVLSNLFAECNSSRSFYVVMATAVVILLTALVMMIAASTSTSNNTSNSSAAAAAAYGQLPFLRPLFQKLRSQSGTRETTEITKPSKSNIMTTPSKRSNTNCKAGENTTPASTFSSPFSSTATQALQWWDDLAPATTLSVDGTDETVRLDTYDCRAKVVHFCFLVHGHRGFSRDLSYLHHRMLLAARNEQQKLREKRKLQRAAARKLQCADIIVSAPTETSGTTVTLDPVQEKEGASENTDHNNEEDVVDDGDDEGNDTDYFRQDIVVHAAVSNEKKTADGVKQGGERLVEEMVTVIRQEMYKRQQDRERFRQQRANKKDGSGDCKTDDDDDEEEEEEEEETIRDITVSVLGNSLGGIYARYAIAKLAERCEKVKLDGDGHHDNLYVLDGSYRIRFNVFCTTATPHLGLADHTFVPIPRTAEIGVAHAMGDTGRDLFRLNDLMKEMATSDEFLEPLGSFRKRIAYANAYGTDFPVPVHTAAFLSESSAYPHHFYEDVNEDDRLVVDEHGFVIATLHTPPKSKFASDEHNAHLNQNDTDELVHMSNSLDALGWKKVFIDVRKEIPKITIPKNILRLTTKDNGSNHESSETEEGRPPDAIIEPIHRLKEKGVAASKEVALAVKGDDSVFHWPLGHNMIVAFSRSRLSSYMNKAGRPVVDFLATQLVQDIFTWKKAGEQ